MSGKLDQSLDDIVKTQRTGRSRGRGGRRSGPGGAARPAAAAPVGGVAKSARAPRGPRAPAAKAAPVVPANGESKIIVSGLPADVSEQQIKDYFSKTIGPVKRALLTYGPNGQSRGIATIFFSQPGSAAKAASTLNGVKVDNRPMKIEVIVGAEQAVAIPAAKGLGDRIAQPKNAAKAQPKPATGGAQNAAGGAKPAGQGRGRKGKRGTGKPKAKSAEELDAEMMDYFAPDAGNGASGEANGAAPVAAAPVAAAGGEGMVEDEIM